METTKFQNINIFYDYAFDLGKPVNPLDAARKLLKADFTGGFINYTTEEQEIAEHFMAQSEDYKKYLKIKKFLDNMEENPTWDSYIKLIAIDPLKWGPIVFNAIRASFQEQELSNQKSGLEDQVNNTTEYPGSNEDNDIESKTSNTEVDSSYDSLEYEVQESVVDFILTLLGRLAIYAGVDTTIFHEDYLDVVPFVRTSLQPFTIIWNSQKIDFDAVVTIHRSGIGLLTCSCHIPKELGVQEVVSLQRPSLLRCDVYEVPATIFGRQYELLGGDKEELNSINEQFASPVREKYLRIDELDDERVLADFFEAYRYSIIENVRGKKYKSLDSLFSELRSRQYFGYPIIFVNYSGTIEELKTQKSESLAKLVMGFTSKSSLKSTLIKKFVDDDLSDTNDSSLYLTEGSALIIDYGGVEEDRSQDPEWIYACYMTTVPIDLLIWQKAILGIYSAQLDAITVDSTGLDQLYTIKRELLSGLNEYQVLGLSRYGSVHDVIKAGQNNLRINEIYTLFTQRLVNIDSVVQLAEGKRRASHERFTRIVTVIISALLSLTAANNIVQIISEWSVVLSREYPPFLELPFIFIVDQVKSRPVYATLIIFLVLFIATIVTLMSMLVNHFKGKQTAIPKTEPERSSPRSLTPMQMRFRKSPNEFLIEISSEE